MNGKSFISDNKNPGWPVLYDKYKTLFIKFALKNFAVDHDTAEDIYQESFIALYENMEKGKCTEPSVSIQTYLFAIGKNKLLNHLRDNTRETVDISENILPPDISGEPEEWKRKQEIVYRTVCEMPEPCSRILTLFYYDRKSMAEIAHTFNYKNEQVAKNRKYLCIGKLKEILIPQLKKEDLI
jgi:RNA polymerase sigma factor (sigma-70 family)